MFGDFLHFGLDNMLTGSVAKRKRKILNFSMLCMNLWKKAAWIIGEYFIVYVI